VLAIEQRNSLIAVLGSKALEDPAVCGLRRRRERPKPFRIKIANYCCIDRAGPGAAGAYLNARRFAGERSLVSPHEFLGARRAYQWHPLATRKANVAPDLAVPVDKFVDVLKADFRQRSSHSLAPAGFSGDCSLPITMTTILPSLSTSTRATAQPAAIAPFTAVVRSRWRNVGGRRDIRGC
jgi:hypothetical protein